MLGYVDFGTGLDNDSPLELEMHVIMMVGVKHQVQDYSSIPDSLTSRES